MNIILVTGASARARTLTLGWRHGLGGSFALLMLLVVFAMLINYVALKWATATQHSWLSAIVLADQREEAQRTQERLQGHLNAMAIRLGELQARMMRLDGVGERLATIAGLKPQELSALLSRANPGTGGAISSQPSHTLSVDEFTALIDRLAGQVEARSDQLGVLETLLVQDAANRKFLPTRLPIVDSWFSSNFGYRIDPFTGQNAFHEGVDFPAEAGTPIIAAASGKVVFADVHPEYGKLVEIEHGNGLVTRYAHASLLLVRPGDLVMAGQRIASVGSTGRSTGPHLHFEIRLKGVAQNPARFLDNARIRHVLAKR
ncbi:MAG: M23 family peptidase [Betaproteobacteria bacterium]|nr:MAG: M23 family peptidase [Betaproteobacteria bacterium]